MVLVCRIKATSITKQALTEKLIAEYRAKIQEQEILIREYTQYIEKQEGTRLTFVEEWKIDSMFCDLRAANARKTAYEQMVSDLEDLI